MTSLLPFWFQPPVACTWATILTFCFLPLFCSVWLCLSIWKTVILLQKLESPFTMQIGSRQSSNILKRLPVTELRIKFNPLSKADNTLQHLTSAYYSSFSHCHFALCSLSSIYICFLWTNVHLRASVPEICWAIGLECSGFIFLHSLSPIFVILVTNQIFLFQRTLPWWP